MKTKSPAALLAVAAALAVPAAATAAKPPHGLYQCYQYSASSGYLYAGGFKLVSATKYKSVSGGTGKYAVKGKKVTFKSGPFHDFAGKFGHDKAGKPIITLTLKSDSSIKETCSHD
jgi:hypothetical protein